LLRRRRSESLSFRCDLSRIVAWTIEQYDAPYF